MGVRPRINSAILLTGKSTNENTLKLRFKYIAEPSVPYLQCPISSALPIANTPPPECAVNYDYLYVLHSRSITKELGS
jgi:hypothetical protein